jgi:dihydrolipoamide dehydrogenase
VELDLKAMMAHKDKVVDANVKGVEFLFKKNKVEWVKGTARIAGPGRVVVGERTLETRNIVIATGSEVAPLRGIEIDEQRIVSSTGALALPAVPASMVVIGSASAPGSPSSSSSTASCRAWMARSRSRCSA